MNRFKKFIYNNWLDLVSMIFYTILGIVTVCFINYEIKNINVFVGVIVLLNSLPFLLNVVREYKLQIPRYIFFVLFCLTLTVGIICLAAPVDISVMLVLWGCIEIVRGVFEICHAFMYVKYIRLRIAECIVGTLDIIFAILLMIKQVGGIRGHLICMGITCFILAGELLLYYVYHQISIKKKQRSKKK